MSAALGGVSAPLCPRARLRGIDLLLLWSPSAALLLLPLLMLLLLLLLLMLVFPLLLQLRMGLPLRSLLPLLFRLKVCCRLDSCSDVISKTSSSEPQESGELGDSRPGSAKFEGSDEGGDACKDAPFGGLKGTCVELGPAFVDTARLLQLLLVEALLLSCLPLKL